jgi:AcrR family transcriptional regulator
MESAVQIIGTKGFNATTISEITDNAGYAKGNFYRYWSSKDDIFLNIMEKRLRDYRASRRDGLARARNVDDVMQVVVDFLETIIDDENWSRVFLEFTIHAFNNQELKSKLNRSNYRLSTDLFAQMFAPFTDDVHGMQKLGALVTALFEGFLIQQALESKVLTKEDLRAAFLVLANHCMSHKTQTSKESA